MRNIEIKCYLTDEELKQVLSCADRELSDPGFVDATRCRVCC